MIKILIIILVVLVGCSSCIALSQGIPEQLLFLNEVDNALMMVDFKSHQLYKLCAIKGLDYDVLGDQIAFFDNNDGNFVLKTLNIITKAKQTICKFPLGFFYDDPTWEDSNDLLVTLVANNLTVKVFRNNLITKKMTEIEKSDMTYVEKYGQSNLSMIKYPDLCGPSKFQVYKDTQLIYQSDECYYPKFINENTVSFTREGNVYLYNLTTKKLVQVTDYSNGKWGDGYFKYSWSKNGFLASEYFIGDKKEIRIFSPQKKLLRIVRYGNYIGNPKWPN